MIGAALIEIALISQVLMVSANPVPPCEISDSHCLKSRAQEVLPMLVEGIPDLDIPSLDTLHIDQIDVELAGLKLTISDIGVTGLSNLVFDDVSINTDKKILQVIYHAHSVLKGKYEASGTLLNLPISGDGDAVIENKNVDVILRMPYELVKNDNGQDTLDLKSYTMKYNVNGAHFDFTNLFDGNKELGDSMMTFINENWKVLTEKFGRPVFEAVHEVLFDAIKKFMATQSVEI